MKRANNKLTFFLIFTLLCPVVTEAAKMQEDLKIKDVFRIYGKNKNVTMVELSKEMLDTYDITFYKSITIKNDPEALTFIRKCLEKDQDGAHKIKEVMSDGGLISAYYQIPGKNSDSNRSKRLKQIPGINNAVNRLKSLKQTPEENIAANRFILFKVNPKGVITLIYIEGELDSDDLITILFTKKDL